jgi:hypothetical protein
MFETLFKQPAVLARYRQGPLLEAREQFLRQCAEDGYSPSMLQKIAWIQLSLAHRLDLGHGKVKARDVELAIEGRKRFWYSPAQNFDGSRQLFSHVATEWVRSLGRGISFIYHKLQPVLYFGFTRQEGVFMAEPEKALLDAAYLDSIGRYPLDWSSLNMGALDKRKLTDLLGPFPERLKDRIAEKCKIS